MIVKQNLHRKRRALMSIENAIRIVAKYYWPMRYRLGKRRHLLYTGE
jgi:hypothetical protein